MVLIIREAGGNKCSVGWAPPTAKLESLGADVGLSSVVDEQSPA